METDPSDGIGSCDLVVNGRFWALEAGLWYEWSVADDE